MKVEKTTKEPIIIVGIPLRTTNENGRSSKEIPLHWMNFFEKNLMEQIPHRKNNAPIGLYTDYSSKHPRPYTLIAGCEVTKADKIPAGMVAKKIPAQTYASINAEGPFPKCLYDAWKSVWESSLDRSYTYDLEIYPEKFDPKNAKIELLIALRG